MPDDGARYCPLMPDDGARYCPLMPDHGARYCPLMPDHGARLVPDKNPDKPCRSFPAGLLPSFIGKVYRITFRLSIYFPQSYRRFMQPGYSFMIA